MKKNLVLIFVFAFSSCNQKCNKTEQNKTSQSQDCVIEEKAEECFEKIFEEPTKIYPLLSHMDNISLNHIQYQGDIPIHFSKIKIEERDFYLSNSEKNDVDKRLIFEFSKVNCSLAKFYLSIMEDDFGRSINGEIMVDRKGLRMEIKGEADIN